MVEAKARLAKMGLTIPCLELVAGHMAVNLLTNVHDALTGYPVRSLNAWLDSTVALHWIRGASEYKQICWKLCLQDKRKGVHHLETRTNTRESCRSGESRQTI